jgi:hypothetical protein
MMDVAVMPHWILLKRDQLSKTVNNFVIKTVPDLEFTKKDANAVKPNNL